MSSFLRSATTGAIVFLSSFPAFAGDRDHWSGAYIGGQMGRAWDSTKWNWNIPDNANIPDITDYNAAFSKDNIARGLQIGYQQKLGIFVPGIEFAYLSHSARGQTQIVDTLDTRTLDARVGDIFSLTGRLGLTQDRWLGYMKAGWAWGDITMTTSQASTGVIQTNSQGRADGFTWGGGLEYALINNLSLGAEYNQYNFKTDREGVQDNASGTTASSHHADASVRTMMLRLNYKFTPSLF